MRLVPRMRVLLRRVAPARPCKTLPQPGRRRWQVQRALLVFGWVVLLLAGLVGYGYESTRIPSDLNDFATQQDNVYYWADGTERARVAPVDRQSVPLDRIPASVQWALLAAENPSFYSDSGISFK